MTPEQKVWEQVAAYYALGQAAKAGNKPCQCPYRFDTEPYRAWVSGFYSWHKPQ